MMYRPQGVMLILLGTLAAGCVLGGDPTPPPDRMARDVAGLEHVLDVVEELRVTEYIGHPDCEEIVYPRGTFVGRTDGEICIADLTQPALDEQARADHRRILTALQSGGANTRMILRVGYDGERLNYASFKIDGAPGFEFYDYLFDPDALEPKVNDEGSLEYTRIDEDWWFVWSYF